MGNGDLALAACVVAVAGIAGDVLLHPVQGLLEVPFIDLHAVVVHQLGEVGGLAGEAVGQGVGPLRLAHVGEAVRVAPGGAVVLGKAVALVDVFQIGVLGQIVHHGVVLLVGLHALGDVGKDALPVLRADGSVPGAGGGGRHGLILDVAPGQGAQRAPVSEVVHDVALQHAAQQQHRRGDDQNAADQLPDDGSFIHRFSFLRCFRKIPS